MVGEPVGGGDRPDRARWLGWAREARDWIAAGAGIASSTVGAVYQLGVPSWAWTLGLGVVLGLMLPRLYRLARPRPPTEMTHLGILWRWRWEDGRPADVVAHCPNPNCHERLEVGRTTGNSLGGPADATRFRCPDPACGFVQVRLGGPASTLGHVREAILALARGRPAGGRPAPRPSRPSP